MKLLSAALLALSLPHCVSSADALKAIGVKKGPDVKPLP
jgi:hypothetical protein